MVPTSCMLTIEQNQTMVGKNPNHGYLYQVNYKFSGFPMIETIAKNVFKVNYLVSRTERYPFQYPSLLDSIDMNQEDDARQALDAKKSQVVQNGLH